MSKYKEKKATPCPVARAVDVIGDRWTLLIIRDAFDGVCRFSEFQRNLAIARNILTDRLKKLVEAGIFIEVPASDGTAYHQYVLTDKGQQLFLLLVGFRQWGERYLFKPDETYSTLIERKTGKSIRPLQLQTQQGDALKPQDTLVKKIP